MFFFFFGWPSTKIVQAVTISQKNMAARGGAYFPLYIYIEMVMLRVISSR